MSEPGDFVICRICEEEFRQITNSHLKRHAMTLEEYKKEFPEASMISEKTRKKQSVVTAGRIASEMTKAKMSATWTRLWKDPGFRANRVSRIGKNNPMHGKTFTHTEETKIKHSEFMTERWKASEYRANHTGKNHPMYGKTFTHTEEAKAKNRTTTIELWKDQEYIDKHTGRNNALYGRTGENAPNWKGGSSFLPYCRLFNNYLKEHVRNRWSRVCINCGKSEIENGRRLDVHHIDGNKMQGCDGYDWLLVPLCRSCNAKHPEDSPFHITLFMFKDLERKSREQQINGG